MTHYVLSDFAGDRLALLKAGRERADAAAAATSPLDFPGAVPPEEERILQAGRDGELAVVQRLLSQVGESGCVISGYQTWHGEIDIVFITSQGVAAIEVKTLNADIRVEGDAWSRNRRGDLDGVAILDEGGRSPSRQLNEAVDHLQRCLKHNGIHVQVQRWVVLAHERSRIVDVKDATVDAVVLATELDANALFGRSTVVPLDPVPVDRVRVLVARDHRRFEQRRASRSAEHARSAVPPVQGWPQTQRMEKLVECARRSAMPGAMESEVDTLRAAIRHDLLVRAQPFETPQLLSRLRDEPARARVVDLVDEAGQIFELPDRCLVALAMPVAVRLRKYLNGDYVRDRANEEMLRSIEVLLRVRHGIRRVILDPRLYTAESLLDVGPQAVQRFLLDLETRGTRAAQVAEPTHLLATRDGRWTLVHVLGVAVIDPSMAERARSWTHLPLPAGTGVSPLAAFDGFDPRHLVPGVLHEASSVGVCALSHGLRVGSEELRRLRTGTQEAAPESIFMVPLRMSL